MQGILRSMHKHKTFCSWHQPQSLAEKLSLLSMEGRLDEAIRILHHPPDPTILQLTSETYLPLIRSCIKFKAFAQGRQIHKHIIESKIKPNVILLNNLMMLYSKCGNLDLTLQVFEGMTERNLFSWTAIIGAYSNSDDTAKAFDFYVKMIVSGIRADHFLYPLVLKSCAGVKALRRGRRIHADVLRSGFQWDLVVLNSLIDMYAKCENMGDAERAFVELGVRDIFTWTTMLVGYVRTGHGLEALKLFREMLHSEVRPSSTTLMGILPLFSDLGCLKLAKQIHGFVTVSGSQYDKCVGTALVDMYSNCGGLGFGRLIFERVVERDEVCWNAMIKSYLQMDLFDDAVELLRRMHIDGINPTKSTWDCIIPHYLRSKVSTRSVLGLIKQLERAGIPCPLSGTLLDQICEHVEDIQQVKELHLYMRRGGYISDSAMASSLVDMYSKFEDLETAREIFDCVSAKELDCWNSMITCYASNGYSDKALELLDSMRKSGIEPNVLSWNTVVSGYVDVGDFEAALEVFSRMKWMNQKPNPASYDIILPVIGSFTNSMMGKQLHCIFFRNECEMSKFVCTTFINMYGNCGDVAYAIKLFESMDHNDLVSWNAIISCLAKNSFLNEASRAFHEMKMAGVAGNIITWTTLVSGYAQNGQVNESLKHFRELQLEGLRPNSITITSILPACAQSAILSHGKAIHGYIIRSGVGYKDLFVGNSLIDMFVKCGCMDYAEKVFRRLLQKDIVSWNTMIQGYVIHGKGEASLIFFNQMLAEGLHPDSVTFVGFLSACSHVGMVDEGWKYFNSMDSTYGITPSAKHYVCMVDLLGRGGHFEDVRNFIVQMPLQPSVSLWGALFSACKTHGNLEMAEYAADHLIELQPEKPWNYVELSTMYVMAGRWNDADHVRKMMVDRGVRRLHGCSWIEVRNRVFSFTLEDSNQNIMEEINRTLLDLWAAMIEEGYIPETNTDSFTYSG
ncbi:hypothetical protein HHK36_018893 [Tetracentron sinense]|uniref:Chlororespiratory reduction 21 n=1 Tax=Tetracentron sinense TaxID=13715 RepID=A0A835DCA1_TETSI|nr:hypothetical protein HHK36_018893 [Tetracentron sinense]